MSKSPDLILHGGRIATLDRANPLASAVAIAFLVLLVGPMAIYQHYSGRELEA